jgi:glycosyltransferase involved in cell wall biosynthesis|tara:strand:- start:22 stop:294 length:273 start_codon:yes stop_codon:yes gene_type:complete
VHKTNPLISIIIPTFHRKKIIEKCLQYVYALDFRDFEFIVVDDGSDGTTEIIKNKFPEVIYFQNQERLGSSESKNIGIRNSKGRIFGICT